VEGVVHAIDALTREAMLFAAIGLLIGGIDDLAIDFVFIVRRLWRGGPARLSLATLPPPDRPGRIAVFVPAWDEVAVIGGMLSAALARFDHADYRLYVGLYPNDAPTIAAAAAVADRDPRVRLVIGPNDGPTTKADCLNTLWAALCRDDAADDIATKAIVLHDAEDVVHPAELTVFDTLIERHAVVQLPVLPLVKRGSQLVSGHYADEFAEARWTLPQLIRAVRPWPVRPSTSSICRTTRRSTPRCLPTAGTSSIRLMSARTRGTASSWAAGSARSRSRSSICRRYSSARPGCSASTGSASMEASSRLNRS
jgi:adsorption protein B